MNKPRLFILGDSFAYWPVVEEKYRWSSLMKDHYDVYNFGISGTDNTHIVFQLGQLPKFREGDRIVIVLSEYSRIPKWYWKNSYDVLINFTTRIQRLVNPSIKEKKVNSLEDLNYGNMLLDLRLYFLKLIKKKEYTYRRDIENPLMLYELVSNLPNLLSKYQPVLVTWCYDTYKLLPNHINVIAKKDFTPIHPETDYHPNEEGHKIWYTKILQWLKDNPKEVESVSFSKNSIR